VVTKYQLPKNYNTIPTKKYTQVLISLFKKMPKSNKTKDTATTVAPSSSSSKKTPMVIYTVTSVLFKSGDINNILEEVINESFASRKKALKYMNTIAAQLYRQCVDGNESSDR
jgi:hypothetical protein